MMFQGLEKPHFRPIFTFQRYSPVKRTSRVTVCFQKGQNVTKLVFLVQISNFVQEWCAEIIENSCSKQLWPPRRPQFNPCDYYFSGLLKIMDIQQAYKGAEFLRDNFFQGVNNFSMPLDANACGWFWPRVEVVIEAGGGLNTKYGSRGIRLQCNRENCPVNIILPNN